MKILILTAEVGGGMVYLPRGTLRLCYVKLVQSVTRCVRNATDDNIDGCVLDTLSQMG